MENGEVKVPFAVNIVVTIAGTDTEDLAAFHKESRDRYIAHTEAFVTALKQYGEERTAIEGLERDIKSIEARWIREGALNDCKNEREREIVLQANRELDVSHQQRTLAVSRSKRLLALEIEPTIEHAKYHRRLAEKDIDWTIASMSALAGIVEAGRHERD